MRSSDLRALSIFHNNLYQKTITLKPGLKYRMNPKETVTIHIDRATKENADALFKQLGMDISEAISLFLRESLLCRGIPFTVTLHHPNTVTASAIEEGRKLAFDRTACSYHSLDALKPALDEVSCQNKQRYRTAKGVL